jgi:hypothetical protein
LGFWEFGGGRVWVKGWDRGGQFTSNLRPRWTDPVTARRVPSRGGRILSQLGGFQVSRKGVKGVARGDKGESARGDKSKVNAPCVNVHCNLCPCIYGMPETFE